MQTCSVSDTIAARAAGTYDLLFAGSIDIRPVGIWFRPASFVVRVLYPDDLELSEDTHSALATVAAELGETEFFIRKLIRVASDRDEYLSFPWSSRERFLTSL